MCIFQLLSFKEGNYFWTHHRTLFDSYRFVSFFLKYIIFTMIFGHETDKEEKNRFINLFIYISFDLIKMSVITKTSVAWHVCNQMKLEFWISLEMQMNMLPWFQMFAVFFFRMNDESRLFGSWFWVWGGGAQCNFLFTV